MGPWGGSRVQEQIRADIGSEHTSDVFDEVVELRQDVWGSLSELISTWVWNIGPVAIETPLWSEDRLNCFPELWLV